MGSIGDIGHILSSNSSVDNITQQYYESKATLESYQNQLKYLQEMYGKADNIQDMLTINDRITEVNGKIKQLTTEIKTMDNQVEYSTVNIKITEVVEFNPTEREKEKEGFGSKIINAWKDAWKGMTNGLQSIVIWLIRHIFGIIIFCTIVFGLYKLVRFLIKKINYLISKDNTNTKISNNSGSENGDTVNYNLDMGDKND